MINSQHLRHALALAEFGNFRRASKSVHISQSAFSRSIQALEDHFNTRLFDRSPGPVTPTSFGEIVIRRARTILTEFSELEREVDMVRGLEAGDFKVAMAPYPAGVSGYRAAGELVRRAPLLHCRFRLSDWQDVIGQVMGRQVDLGLAEISEAEAHQSLATEIVGRHKLHYFCRKGHPLGELESVSGQDLDAFPLVATRIPARFGPKVPGRMSIEPVTGHVIPSVEVEDMATIKAIVARSDAISASALSQIEPEIRSGEFICIPLESPRLQLGYGFIYRADRSLSPATELFMQLVREVEQETAARSQRLEAELVHEGYLRVTMGGSL